MDEIRGSASQIMVHFYSSSLHSSVALIQPPEHKPLYPPTASPFDTRHPTYALLVSIFNRHPSSSSGVFFCIVTFLKGPIRRFPPLGVSARNAPASGQPLDLWGPPARDGFRNGDSIVRCSQPAQFRLFLKRRATGSYE